MKEKIIHESVCDKLQDNDGNVIRIHYNTFNSLKIRSLIIENMKLKKQNKKLLGETKQA